MQFLATYPEPIYSFRLTWAEKVVQRFCDFKTPSGSSVNPELSDMAEIELLRSIAQGDRHAFARLYDRYAAILCATAAKILNDAKEAEDVLQEVFLQIWDKAGNYDSNLGRPLTWALTLTRNKAIDRLRSAQRRYKLVEAATPELAENQPSNGGSFNSDQNLIVQQAVRTLPAEQRQAIELAFFGGLTQDEISQNLQQPLGTIKARIRRGMIKLRDNLEGKL